MEGLREHSPAYDVIIACAAGEVRERGGRDSGQQLAVMGGNARLVVSCVLGHSKHVWQCSCVAMLMGGNARLAIPCVLGTVGQQ